MNVLRAVSSVDRCIAAALALVWVGAGIGGLVLGLLTFRWVLVAISVLACIYGIAWVRVARSGRLLTGWRDLLLPEVQPPIERRRSK